MNARNMRHVIQGLALSGVIAASLMLGGCTHRLIIEEQAPETGEAADQTDGTTGHTESAIGNSALYVRSGNSEPGEQRTGPQPEPWQQRLGPQPEPWQNDGDDDGTSPPPPDSNPGDPNPKP
jgi:hypothetical protein